MIQVQGWQQLLGKTGHTMSCQVRRTLYQRIHIPSEQGLPTERGERELSDRRCGRASSTVNPLITRLPLDLSQAIALWSSGSIATAVMEGTPTRLANTKRGKDTVVWLVADLDSVFGRLDHGAQQWPIPTLPATPELEQRPLLGQRTGCGSTPRGEEKATTRRDPDILEYQTRSLGKFRRDWRAGVA